MSASTSTAEPVAGHQRPPRLLWANAFCLLDTTSGASLTAREMLRQLVDAGVEVKVLGATVFDHPSGADVFGERLAEWQRQPARRVTVRDSALTHELITTASPLRDALSSREADAWWVAYQALIDDFRPDVVWGYGGLNLEMLASAEARARGIPYLSYLVNGSYTGSRWARDVRQVITDSRATADYYRDRLPCPITPVGTFIPPERVVPPRHRRERLLFINPTWSKGAGIVAQLAILMGRCRPDIPFEVVESRGQWARVVKAVSAAMGEPRDSLPNVMVTPHTRDMKPVYARARLLLAPSLWWESGARVLAEAMLNGIPAVITRQGGSPEMIGQGGLRFSFPRSSVGMHTESILCPCDRVFTPSPCLLAAHTAQTIRTEEYPMSQTNPTLDDVWRLFHETDRKFQDTDQKIKAMTKTIEKLGHRLGDYIEDAVRPAAVRLFRERGIEVHEVHQNISAQRGDEGIEVDLLVVNDGDVIAIECKSLLSVDDVNEHRQRLDKLKRLLPSYANKRVLGTVTAMVIPEDVARYAYRQGLFVIGQSGEQLVIRNDAHFQPKAW